MDSPGPFQISRAVLHPDNIRMLGQRRDGFGRQVDARHLRKVIQQDKESWSATARKNRICVSMRLIMLLK